MGVTVCSERSSCPCLCSGVFPLAHGKCEVMARYHVQTAYVRFKVQYEESRAQCGHYVRLLSSTRITLWGCAVNNWKQISENCTTTKGSICKKIPPMQRSDDFVGWNSGKMNRVCCRAVCSFRAIIRWKWWLSQWESPLLSVGFGIKGIMEV